jgi:hypothetical protein
MDAEMEWGVGHAVGGEPMYRRVRMRVGTTWYSAQMVDTYGYGEPAPHSALHFLGYVDETGAHQFTEIPYGDEGFAWTVQQLAHMAHTPPASVDIEIAGERVPVDLNRLPPGDTAKMVGPVWCPVANLASERPYGRGGFQTWQGSKHFAVGAKLYCFPPLWGDGYNKIKIIGRHRATHKFITVVVSSSWLTNWRVDLAYDAHLIREFWPAWDGTQRSKERAKELVDEMNDRIQVRAQTTSQGSAEQGKEESS